MHHVPLEDLGGKQGGIEGVDATLWEEFGKQQEAGMLMLMLPGATHLYVGQRWRGTEAVTMTVQDFLHGGFVWFKDAKMLKLKTRLGQDPRGPGWRWECAGTVTVELKQGCSVRPLQQTTNRMTAANPSQ